MKTEKGRGRDGERGGLALVMSRVLYCLICLHRSLLDRFVRRRRRYNELMRTACCGYDAGDRRLTAAGEDQRARNRGCWTDCHLTSGGGLDELRGVVLLGVVHAIWERFFTHADWLAPTASGFLSSFRVVTICSAVVLSLINCA